MALHSVLIIGDSIGAAQWGALDLAQRGFTTTVTDPAEETLGCLEMSAYDLLVIDLDLPCIDGLGLCRQLRADGIGPILLLTSRNDDDYLVAAYRAGAGECIVKPISRRLFWAKVTTWLHRSWMISVESLDELQVGNLCLVPGIRRIATANGFQVNLTNLEFRLLHLLMSHPGQKLEGETIMDLVWGTAAKRDEGLLQDVIRRLCHKLESGLHMPCCIHTAGAAVYLFQID